MSSIEEKLALVKDSIKDFPDFPKKGVLFKDIFSALTIGPVCTALKDVVVSSIRKNFPDVEAIVGLEARGFLFSFAVAAEMGVGCIPVRKQGKLPGSTIKCEYDLEYGSAVVEVQKESFSKPGLKVLVIDDLIATGGTMEAAIKLLRRCNAEVLGCLGIIELLDLKGREKMADVRVVSLIQY